MSNEQKHVVSVLLLITSKTQITELLFDSNIQFELRAKKRQAAFYKALCLLNLREGTTYDLTNQDKKKMPR